MYRDLRVRNSCRPTPVPRNHQAFVFSAPMLDRVVYKVITAPSFVIAAQRIKDFNNDQGLDLFWTLVCEDDFEVVYQNDVPPSLHF